LNEKQFLNRNLLVRILKDFADLDLFRQTPGRVGVWEEIRFTEVPVESSDYVLVLNKPGGDVTVRCPPEHIWAVMQEPPNEVFGWMHQGDQSYTRVYTTDERLPENARYIHSQPALAWHVEKDYDFLIRTGIPEKSRPLSWVTSNKSIFRGHRTRMRFLQGLQNRVEFDLFGTGFRHIKDKWEGLAPYRYSLAIENFSNAFYWSEKIADCFLAWSMPIYYGCTRIIEYFPAEAMLIIDIHDPRCVDRVREAIQDKTWERNLEAIAYARQLVLDKYQLFPFIAQEIRAHEAESTNHLHQMKDTFIPCDPRVPLGYKARLQRLWRRITPANLRRTIGRVRQLFE
jgi:Glycosyltransferase family 10 (fucosyltransferase) C-term